MQDQKIVTIKIKEGDSLYRFNSLLTQNEIAYYQENLAAVNKLAAKIGKHLNPDMDRIDSVSMHCYLTEKILLEHESVSDTR